MVQRDVVPGSQLGDFVDFVPCCDADQNVPEIGVGFDPAHFCRFDEGCDDGPMPGAAITAGEEGIFDGKLLGPYGAFDGTLVHFDAAIGEEQAQAGRPAENITDGLGEFATARDQRKLLLEPSFEVVHQRERVFLTNAQPEVWWTAPDSVLDAVERRVAEQGFFGDWRSRRLMNLEEVPAGVNITASDLDALAGLAPMSGESIVVGAVAVAMKDALERGQVVGGVMVPSVLLINVGDGRRPIPAPWSFISRVCPEVAGLGLASARIEYRDRGFIAEDNRRSQNVGQDIIVDGFNKEAGLADPEAQGLAIKLDPLALEALGLTVQRKIVSVFVDDDAGQQSFGRHTTGDGALRRRGLDDGSLAGATSIFGPMGHHDLQCGRNPIQLFGGFLADNMQSAVTARAGFLFRLNEAVLVGKVIGQGAAIVLARNLGLVITSRQLFPLVFGLVLGVHRGEVLVEVFDRQLELVGRQLFGAPAELVALQFHDDGAQPVAFGQGMVKLELVIIPLSLVAVALPTQRRGLTRSIHEQQDQLTLMNL